MTSGSEKLRVLPLRFYLFIFLRMIIRMREWMMLIAIAVITNIKLTSR